MLESTPIKNIDNPPYFFRIRGKLFMNFMLICSGIVLMGLIGSLVCILLGYGWAALGVFLSSLLGVIIVHAHYAKKGKSVPFKDLKKSADIISHINFNKITEC